ncbi:hydroxyacid dehydrogenase [Roseomonas sp. GCM10028921]
MPQILVPDEIHQDGLARLRDRERYLLDDGALTSENRRERLAIADGMIVRGTRIDRALLDAAPRLRFVCRHGVGYDHVDVPALTERGILLAVTPEANAASVAEHALMLMLASARQLRATDAAVRRGEWRVRGSSQAFDLADRTVLLVGFGRIGIRVARLCTSIGMRVLVFDPYVPGRIVRAQGCVPVAGLAEGLAAADVVSLHCPSNDRTRGMVDASFLAAMRPGAVLVNTARGTLVDEPALEAALRSGPLSAAGLDVLAVEPMAQPVPLLALPNVFLTPHVAASSEQGLRRMAVSAAENVVAFFEGGLDPEALINPEAGGSVGEAQRMVQFP